MITTPPPILFRDARIFDGTSAECLEWPFFSFSRLPTFKSLALRNQRNQGIQRHGRMMPRGVGGTQKIHLRRAHLLGPLLRLFVNSRERADAIAQ